MSDRGSDLDIVLDILNVEKEKNLKCCVYIILGIDNAIEKVLRNTEQLIGVQKLLKLTAGDKAFNSPSTSIHTLGLIALSKLLSPSHAANSVSLYCEYKLWIDEHQHQIKNNFVGFQSNRFGRIAELSKMYIAHQSFLKQFFEDTVDIHSNKLVLAVDTFINNQWFKECCELYSKFGDLIIFPLMKFLGIDDKSS